MQPALSKTLQDLLPTLGALIFLGAHFGCGGVVEVSNAKGSGGSAASSTQQAASTSNTSIAVTNTVGAGGYGTSSGVVTPGSVAVTGYGVGGGVGTGPIPGDGGAGVGGAPASLGCSSLCDFETICAGAPIANCLPSCGVQESGACSAAFRLYLNCVVMNHDVLAMCGLSEVCDSSFLTYTGCVASQSMTDAAAVGAGAGPGGGAGACQGEECFFDSGGPCNCTQSCGNATLATSCSDLPGGAMCGCTEGDVYLGSCYEASWTCSGMSACCQRYFTISPGTTSSTSVTSG